MMLLWLTAIFAAGCCVGMLIMACFAMARDRGPIP